MTSKELLDVVEVLTSQDGNFNEEIGAYVTAYPVTKNTDYDAAVAVELEYVDRDNNDEVIEVKTFTIYIIEDKK